MPAISLEHVSKLYRVPVRNTGVMASVRSLFCPQYEDVSAVEDISFAIQTGEMVGFIGPNGAGKTTTLKLLSGLLHPSAGAIRVAGHTPYERRPEFLRSVSLVMGNKSQLAWENTIGDYFLVLKDIYSIPVGEYRQRLAELTALLEIEPLLPKLARNLSLGERAKCELAAALLHRPSVVFLDEPTLGLDVTMQLRLRTFLREYNKNFATTVVLTSHYMEDIQQLCSRVILIHHGRVLFDGRLADLSARLAPFKLVTIPVSHSIISETSELPGRLRAIVDVIAKDESHTTLRVKSECLLETINVLIGELAVRDFTVQDPPIEAVIDQVYREGVSL